MACERPIIANMFGEIAIFAKDHQLGIIKADFDADSIKNVLVHIFNNKYDKSALGKMNRQIAEKYLSWEAQSVKLLNFYRSRL